MKLSATHAFNCIVLMVKFGRTSCEDIPLALFNSTWLAAHSMIGTVPNILVRNFLTENILLFLIFVNT